MSYATASANMEMLSARLLQQGGMEIVVGGVVIWLILRRLLPTGSQYVLKQTILFFALCLLGQLGAALLDVLGWSMAASA